MTRKLLTLLSCDGIGLLINMNNFLSDGFKVGDFGLEGNEG